MAFPVPRVLLDPRVTKASTDIREHTEHLELPDAKANLAAAACRAFPARRERRESVAWTEPRARPELGVWWDHRVLPVRGVTTVPQDEQEPPVQREFLAPLDATDPGVRKENRLSSDPESSRLE